MQALLIQNLNTLNMVLILGCGEGTEGFVRHIDRAECSSLRSRNPERSDVSPERKRQRAAALPRPGGALHRRGEKDISTVVNKRMF